MQLCAPDGAGLGILRYPIEEGPEASSADLVETSHEEEDQDTRNLHDFAQVAQAGPAQPEVFELKVDLF